MSIPLVAAIAIAFTGIYKFKKVTKQKTQAELEEERHVLMIKIYGDLASFDEIFGDTGPIPSTEYRKLSEAYRKLFALYTKEDQITLPDYMDERVQKMETLYQEFLETKIAYLEFISKRSGKN